MAGGRRPKAEEETTGTTRQDRIHPREETPMKLKMTTLALGAALAAGPAMAELVFPSLSYRTGPYAANGIPLTSIF